MKIYVSHSRNFDYKKTLYELLKTLNNYHFIFPHEADETPFNSKKLLENKEVDLVLAEVTFPSTGQVIELGWVNVFSGVDQRFPPC